MVALRALLQLSVCPAEGLAHPAISFLCAVRVMGDLKHCGKNELWVRAGNGLGVGIFTGRGDGGRSAKKKGEVGTEYFPRTPAGGWTEVGSKAGGENVEMHLEKQPAVFCENLEKHAADQGAVGS